MLGLRPRWLGTRLAAGHAAIMGKAPTTWHGSVASFPTPVAGIAGPAGLRQTDLSPSSLDFDNFVDFIQSTQQKILQDATHLDGSGRPFLIDRWHRDDGDPNAGYGITAVLEDGQLLEKAAANVSVIRGTLSPVRAQAMSARGRSGIDPKGGQPYAAAALSLVFHSAHPLLPTLRGDVRLFQVEGQAWVGGGCDLTPSYIVDGITDFHTFWKRVCDRYDRSIYLKFKEDCDSYFYLPARKEHRGVGGIFYDDLSSEEAGFDVVMFTQDVGLGLLPSWLPVAEKQRSKPFSEEQRKWQLLRRGRYLEFNLLWDRGVRFGLEGGRMESIMVSAPPLIAWKYNVTPAVGSEEARLVQVLQKPLTWA